MATYAIGDLQGCHDQLLSLLAHIGYQPGTDRLWFTGDLVNRGPDSLGVLRFIKSLGESAVSVADDPFGDVGYSFHTANGGSPVFLYYQCHNFNVVFETFVLVTFVFVMFGDFVLSVVLSRLSVFRHTRNRAD